MSGSEKIPSYYGAEDVDHGADPVHLPRRGLLLVGGVGAFVFVHVPHVQVVREPLADQDRQHLAGVDCSLRTVLFCGDEERCRDDQQDDDREEADDSAVAVGHLINDE